MIIIALVLLGLCFGSFVNALVYRLHQQSIHTKTKNKKTDELSIVHGRSMCPNCKHTLQGIDLIPVLSWIILGGKCRYCRKPILWQYPLVELGTAALFVISYLYWPYFHGQAAEAADAAGFAVWLACVIGLMALTVYDLRWMLLPNRIIFPLYGLVAVFIASRLLAEMSLVPLKDAAIGVLIGGGLFYFLFQVSGGKWIGGGDVKLGFLLGALVGGPIPACAMLFFASLLATVAVVPLLASKKVSRSSRIPFGPFLISAAILVQLFGQQILDWYIDFFI